MEATFSREIATRVHQKRSNLTSTGTSYSFLKTLSTLNEVITEITVRLVSMTHNKIRKTWVSVRSASFKRKCVFHNRHNPCFSPMRTAQDVVLNIVWALCNVCETASCKCLCKHLRICLKMTSEVTTIPLSVLTFRNTIFKSLSKWISTWFLFGQKTARDIGYAWQNSMILISAWLCI